MAHLLLNHPDLEHSVTPVAHGSSLLGRTRVLILLEPSLWEGTLRQDFSPQKP